MIHGTRTRERKMWARGTTVTAMKKGVIVQDSAEIRGARALRDAKTVSSAASSLAM